MKPIRGAPGLPPIRFRPTSTDSSTMRDLPRLPRLPRLPLRPLSPVSLMALAALAHAQTDTPTTATSPS
ncbi:hypothetical protein DN511_30820, partial [Burkholderia multivorans]